MSQQLINTGLADKGNGDPIRTAFTKVNENFAELYNSVSAVVVASATAPTAPAVGDLWWNSVDGRMYVYYGTSWVDASPVDGAGISSTNQLVNGAYTVSLESDGVLTLSNGTNIYGDGIFKADAVGGFEFNSFTDNIGSGKKTWTFSTDGNLTFPDSTVQSTAWTGITGFGEGFGLTDADKIVTNKLYSTNLTQPTQHYRLELDTNGVVRLPDGSIINGSTIRGVAGTSELNYTGITIGPNSNDAEKTWMWVDHANAYISTNNAANTWTFGNNGSLTFPDTTAQTTAWTGSVSSLVNSTKTVSLGTDGTLTLPLGSTLGETPAAITVTIYGAGYTAFNQTYTRTYGDPTYPDQYLGSNNCRIFRDSGTANKWRLREVSTDYYESDDLVTWTDFIGGADPAPTGIVSLKTADITVGTNTWKFNTNGSLTFPDGKSSIYTLDLATSGGINGIVMNGKDRAYIGIENEAFGYGWDFRAFGLADYSTTLKPAIKFPGSGWLQEDFTDIMNENVPLQLGSQGSITLTATGVVPPTAYNWVFGRDGSLTFPDNTVQTTAYLGITNKAGPSATIAVGSIMTRNDLSVRVTNNSNTLDLEIKYSSPDGQRLVSAYKSYPSVANIYSGRTLKAANNTTWDLIGNLPLEGDSLGFTFTDHSMLKVYRVTVVADIMPGGGGGGALGEVFCTIEELK